MKVASFRTFLFLCLCWSGALLPGCRCGDASNDVPMDPAKGATAFGAAGQPDLSATDLAALLTRARAVVDGEDAPAQAALPRAGAPVRRVFLTAYSPPFAPQTTTALTNTLDDAVTVAATELAPRLAKNPLHPTRLALDVITSVSSVNLAQPLKVEGWAIGLDGYAAQAGDRFSALLPNVIAEEKMYSTGKTPQIKAAEVTTRLRQGLADADPSTWTSYRFSTTRVVEPLRAGAPLALFRDMVPHGSSVSPEQLVAAVKSGADYLSHAMIDSGHFAYMYHPVEDHEDSAYGLLRHAGAVYALFEAYDELHDPLYLDKGQKGLDYLRTRFKVPSAANGVAAKEPMLYLSDNADEEQQKVGGNGLALLAYTKKAEATGSKADLDVMRQLGLFIVRQQYPDGHFRSNEDVEKESPTEGKGRKKEVIYFAGEAIFGLLHLYNVDPDPRWLEAARKGADFCVKIRDAGQSAQTIEHDHWLSYALNELQRRVPDQAYVDHALLIADGIKRAQHSKEHAPSPDFVGSFYAEAPSTPASVRLEALVADMRLMRFLGKSTDDLLPSATAIAAFTTGQQYNDENDFFLKNPERARGGVRESVVDDDIRIDYVQHAMSGWLHLARLLRDPAYGTAADNGGGPSANGHPTLLDAGP
jgi:hypothetical protein